MVIKDSKKSFNDSERIRYKQEFDAEEEIFVGGGTNPPDYIIEGLKHCDADRRSREEIEERRRLFKYPD